MLISRIKIKAIESLLWQILNQIGRLSNKNKEIWNWLQWALWRRDWREIRNRGG